MTLRVHEYRPQISRACRALLASAALLVAATTARAEEPLLERDVMPILTKQCLGCHGGLRQKANLDFRTIPGMLKGGESGVAVKAGDLKASLMWEKISADEMPPHEKKLAADEKETIRRWIAAGLPTLREQQQGDVPLLQGSDQHEPRQVAAAIDQHLDRALATVNAKAAPPADDSEFLRRVFLDLTGRVPTAAQAAAFLDGTDPDKRPKLIDTLLATPEFGEQFGRTWRDWICPPELPSDPNGGKQPHAQAQNFGRWLGERFAAGEPWDKIVRQILTVEGDIKNQPQVIFFGLVGDGGKPSAAGSTRAVASLFLGVQMQCAQCHDDPYRAWSQNEHWGLAAYFGSVSGDFNKISDSSGSGTPQVVVPKTAFKNAGATVPAAFLGGPAQRQEKVGPPRACFADWLTAKDNPYFARAFANRVWFYFFARGIVNPVDDFRELNPPSHPGLMALLANEFTASNYDVKHLVRCVCNSQAYERTSRVAPGANDATVATQTTWFGRMPLRVMTADMLYDSLKLAYGDEKLDLRAIDPKDGNTNGESAPVADNYLEFLRRFGTNKDDATDFTHGIPQMLTLLNHPRLLTGSAALEKELKVTPARSPEQTLEWLYLSTLSRRPSGEELAEAQRYVVKAQDPTQAYVGVLWMLVNRSEFMLIR